MRNRRSRLGVLAIVAMGVTLAGATTTADAGDRGRRGDRHSYRGHDRDSRHDYGRRDHRQRDYREHHRDRSYWGHSRSRRVYRSSCRPVYRSSNWCSTPRYSGWSRCGSGFSIRF